MDSEYDKKFEEMKKYIPFLENMIKQLELMSTASNPRQAQLYKIRSLRDLLMDKKKRMKMENLLKCEQVLVNLYAKVEKVDITDQRDTLPGIQKAASSSSETKLKSDLDFVRNKLKSVTKSIREDPETLPDIAKATETEVVCTPGSKEPALFQRRPNKASISPSRSSPKKSPKPAAKGRVFTRVLKSPEPSNRRWSLLESKPDKPLFSRRSPQRSPRRHSPPHQKKDRIKSSKTNEPKDFNITLKVPEESLNSLNTDDILSRIIKCRDGDVDIDTLRDLRTQILSELKQTGANDDISDLILKSYKKKKRKGKEKHEVEEGELSDSESEAIDSIYGSLVVVDKDKGTSKQTKTSDEKDKQPRKIQICLVINADKDITSEQAKLKDTSNSDFDIEVLSDTEKPHCEVLQKSKEKMCAIKDNSNMQKTFQENKIIKDKSNISQTKPQEIITIDDDDEEKTTATAKTVVKDIPKTVVKDIPKTVAKDIPKTVDKDIPTVLIDLSGTDSPQKKREEVAKTDSDTDTACEKQDSIAKIHSEEDASIERRETEVKTLSFKPNFYKPINDADNSEKTDIQAENVTPETPLISDLPVTVKSPIKTPLTSDMPDTVKSPIETPIINDLPKDVFEKPQIQNPIQPNSTVTSDVDTSVKNLKEPESKKNEEVKEDRAKSPPVEIPLLNEPPIPAPPPKKDVVSEIDILQALKNEILGESITIPGSETDTPALHQPKLTKVSSAQEIMNKKRISIEKYKQKSVTTSKTSLFVKDPHIFMSKEDYAKKQSLKLTEKECERFNFPAKLALDESSDDDLTEEYSLDDIYRDLAPESPENDTFGDAENAPSPIIIPADPVKTLTVTTNTDVDMRTLMPLVSPTAAKFSANNKAMSPSVRSETPGNRNERISEINRRPLLVDPRVRRENKPFNMESPNPHIMNPDRTPRSANFPNMTPNARTYELTPSRQSIDSDDSLNKKHVYAPIFSAYDPRDHRREQSESREGPSKQNVRPRWEPNVDMTKEGRRSRWETDNRDRSHSRNWDDRNSSAQRDADYTKSRYNDPADKYQRNDRYGYDKRDDYFYRDCPLTPSHSFGRSDCPATPTPSFGRLEAPMTPVHAFGRSECPATPSHPFGRSDGPTTPSHPFGRSDCPSTPSHPFGRSECPTTPSHPFGRSDCPTTPSHPFGRSDCPTTPSHPFGRSDMGMAPMTPSHPFGRSDYSQNNMSAGPKYVKDPRLNRIDSESASRNFNDDRDRGYYDDRRKSDGQNRHYNASDSYRSYNRDQNVGRDRNRPYEQSGRNYSHEPSIGRGNKGLETNRLYSRERDRRDDYQKEDEYTRNKNDASSRNFQRSHSVGRNVPSEDNFVPSYKQDRNYRYEMTTDKKLSVKQQSGSSFTIDTSVNKTFQEFLNGKGMQVFDYSFDARRQRASSVGRSLTRESSVGRSVRETSVGRTISKPTFDNSSLMRKDFVRARSVGRDMTILESKKSLKDIKADFEKYSASYKKKDENRTEEKKNNRDPRSRKLDRENPQKEKFNTVSKSAYSPRKNSRDPRLGKERPVVVFESRYKIDRRKDRGIVYTNDNIAKGTVLGSGYSVKNYKIPKIKHVEEPVQKDADKNKTTENKDKEGSNKEAEKKVTDATTKSKASEKKEKGSKTNVKEKDRKDSYNTKSNVIGKKQREDNIKSVAEDNMKSVDNSNKRTTRSSRNNTETKNENDIVTKSRKTRKSVIYDSDSDSESVSTEKKDIDDLKTSIKNENPSKKPISPIKQKKIDNKEDVISASFGMDDLEIFPDNMASDPVMANINALIADLDNDIDTSKPDEASNQFTSEINLEKIFNSFSSPDRNSQDFTEDVSLKDISELITEDLLRSDSKSTEQKKQISNEIDIKETPVKENYDIQTNVSVFKSQQDKDESVKNALNADESKVLPTNSKLQIQSNEINKASEFTDNETKLKSTETQDSISKLDNEVIDSTTETDKEEAKKVEEMLQTDTKVVERSLTPDSTNTNDIQSCDDKGLPDSTNEMHNEMQSDITSTHGSTESSNKDIEPNSSQQESVSKVDSIGNLLSMLQDKSKIKELLTMLGASDNEKIKKKLEKLSEIVSDDEDTNDVVKQDNNVESDLKEHDTTEENKSFEINTKVSDETKNTVTESEILKDKDETEDDKNKTINEEGSDTTNITTFNDEASLEDTENASISKINKPRKKPRKKRGKWKAGKKEVNRVTRSTATLKAKKPKIARELKQLQDDIKEMFISDDILKATGIRMCRIAKLVGDKNTSQDEENVLPKEIKPVVILEKFKDKDMIEDALVTAKIRKKPGPKSKVKVPSTYSAAEDVNKKEKAKPALKYKPGPKSKTKHQSEEADPYLFNADSVSETNTLKETDNDLQNSSESENDSLSSSKSYGSSEILAELKKKPKRKRNSWQSGVIKPIKRKKKIAAKQTDTSIEDDRKDEEKNEDEITVPDISCFTDKTYCFSKNVTIYSCRLCKYSGADIVHHYKKNHPHSEIPLSRMSPKVALDAIDQCDDINFQVLSQLRSDRYVCRFCFKEFAGRGRGMNCKLEEFFWHVVSMHTGEYKQLCSECINVTRCPFNLDIPPPPKEVKGQLIGYICGKCNFTQISLENLKTHVIVRHNDEQTAVYTINLATMTKKTMEALMKRSENMPSVEQPRLLRSGRSNQSLTDASDSRSDITESTDRNIDLDLAKRSAAATKSASKITFENDVTAEISNMEDTQVKVETEDKEEEPRNDTAHFDDTSDIRDANEPETEVFQRPSDDIFDCAHFKVSYTDSGIKEYVCCVNGKDNHYKTSLLISMKKHVQHKHSEKWDGYCYVCKLIVTPQGEHRFKECFQHYLDKHMDNFPVLGPIIESTDKPESIPESSANKTIEGACPKPYINVRPIADLLSKNIEAREEAVALPIIESVISLGNAATPPPPSPGPSSLHSEIATSLDSSQINEVRAQVLKQQLPCKYEEAQAEIMSKKLRAVLDSMLSNDKLVRIFKCAGRYCSFTSDSAEDALIHASTHQRIGGENALVCTYCDFDCAGNAIDLVMHVFKNHGCCRYACRKCFYRASASQLVRAHMLRKHGEEVAKEPVLMTDIVTPVVDDKSEILPREVAVQYYVCQDMETSCKFRTFTQGKFCEHLFKHQPPYLCSVCTEGFLQPTELSHHLKTHGMKLYQCTWCVHGADNETELLAHASEKHPTKQPQAYLRIINTKQGTSKMMVLPLAQLNKSKVRVEQVALSSTTDNPQRDAERSIELERLIGSMPSVEPRPVEVNKEPETVSKEQSSESNDDGILLEPPRLETPPPNAAPGANLSLLLTPVLKTEPLDETPGKEPPKNDVICLDSDEEDSRDSGPGVIAVSDEDAASKDVSADLTHKKVPSHKLNKCSKCLQIYKTKAAFKRHIQGALCFPLSATEDIPCAHCPFIAHGRNEIYLHYQNHEKLVKQDRFVCGICDYSGELAVVKNHLQNIHSVKNIVVTSRLDEVGEFLYTVSPKQPPKRKLSAGKIETPAKRKRYGPSEVDQLPTKPILDELVYCSLCEFNTKVRLNMVRHLQQHAELQPVADTVPVNPVPHLESNEKHFDRMVNLASSSVVTRAPDKQARVESNPTVNLVIPPEAAARYPKYVPERQRHTCGAKGCSYTSVDEAMLKYHWEALHTGTIDFHCVHCPPYQHLDTSRPLTASRIVAHLKMHDVRLYACSSCTYYHFKRQVLDKHLAEVHKGAGQLLVVREEVPSTQPGIGQPTSSAPTMDLKPWQCGLCKFKSMLRPEVIEHCAKTHGIKMQFKCPNCPFRGSNLENVTRHQLNSHPESKEVTIHFYYREGSIPDQPDGTPRWLVQRQKLDIPDSEVKTEIPDNTTQIPSEPQPVLPATPAPVAIDMNIVKQEIVESEEESMEQLCERFGQFCEPNGLKYKCPLCKVVIEDNKDTMQSHLYEELKYRKWGCSVCSYKAFHKTGLHDHMASEHKIRQNQIHVDLPLDVRVEKWVSKLLEHQTSAMEKNRENLVKQRIQVEKPPPSKNTNQELPAEAADEPRMKELEDAFGQFGEAKNDQFCCPKCDFQNKEEAVMRDHLESELNQIRWRCSNCLDHYQNYHEAQLHCKSVHSGLSARPIDAARDPGLRAAWVNAVLKTQKPTNEHPETSMQLGDTSDMSPLENSLLVVRYEERVPTPEAEMLLRRKRPPPVPVATASTSNTADSDDERLVIDEINDETAPAKPRPKKAEPKMVSCPHCDFSSRYNIHEHILRHYDMKLWQCNYCDYSCTTMSKKQHHEKFHPDRPVSYTKNTMPDGPPTKITLLHKGRKSKDEETKHKEDPKAADDGPKVICLNCEKAITETESRTHSHENVPVYFGKKGDVVVKCCICFSLLPNVNAMLDHNNSEHPKEAINYAFFKLHHDSREIHHCGHCSQRFKFLRDLKSHHNALHNALQLKYTTKPHVPGGNEFMEGEPERDVDKRRMEDSTIYPPAKKIAKKSTTKLPTQTIAKKSTTKLPFKDSDSEDEEYSYYGTKPTALEEILHVTTLLPGSDTEKPVDVKALSDITQISPKVIVKDLNK